MKQNIPHMGFFKKYPVASLRPRHKNIFLDEGFRTIDEHPEGNFVILGKQILDETSGKPLRVDVVHLKKFGPPTRLVWDKKLYDKVGKLFEEEPEIEETDIVTVEVKQASISSAWYRDHIGMKFEVYRKPDYGLGGDILRYKLVTPLEGKADSYIRAADCKVVKRPYA